MRTSRKIGMRSLLLIHTLVPMVVTMVLVALVLVWSSRTTVNDMTQALGLEVGARIGGHVDAFLESVGAVNAMNVALVRAGRLDPENPRELTDHFLNQIGLMPSANSVYFANARGGLAGAGIDHHFAYATATEDFTAGPFTKHAVDEAGRPDELLATVPDFDARTRDWYAAARTADATVWTEAYVLATGQDMAIAASHAAFDAYGRFVGVFSVDVFLSRLSDFLRGLTYGTSGVGIIVDRAGYLVAASHREPLFEPIEGAGGYRRLAATESGDRTTRLAVSHLVEEFGLFDPARAESDSPTSHRFRADGEWFTVVLGRIDLSGPADWRTIVVFPERDFLYELDRGYTIAVILLAVILVVLVIVVVRLSWKVTLPLVQLSSSLGAFEGERLPTIGEQSVVREIEQVLASFNVMNDQLHETLSMLNREVAERRRSEQQLSASLDERTVLMRELNHRTKNNMNVISSMVQLQAIATADPTVARALGELERRIRSMALVHEKLYQSESLSSINLADYFADLVDLLQTGLAGGGHSLSIELDVEQVTVGIDVAVPCGLVVNELVTNAAKHAFRGRESGTVSISLRKLEAGRVSLDVSDDGVGLPVGFDPRHQDSLGLRLVYAIVEQQLDGKVTFDSVAGVRCVCEFEIR